MFYLIVFNTSMHYQDERDLACVAEIYREDETHRNYSLGTHINQ